MSADVMHFIFPSCFETKLFKHMNRSHFLTTDNYVGLY